MKRVSIPELQDGVAGSPEDIAQWLGDLRFLNRWFGGISTTSAMLRKLAERLPQRTIRMLDVGAASGDVALGTQNSMRRHGFHMEITLLDRLRTHLLLPPGRASGSAPGVARENPRCVVADAMALPFADSSFDVVACGLFAHHFEPEQLPHLVAESLRVCRIAVIINDLRRSPLLTLSTLLVLPAFRNRFTRHDALASVRRAYTMSEMRTMLKEFEIEIQPHFFFRMGLIVWKLPASSVCRAGGGG